MRDGSKADDTPSEAVRTREPVDRDEVDGSAVASIQLVHANGNGTATRRSSGGLMGRYWSTTSVLDMASAYNRSVMPRILTDAEERMLEDVEEETSDWDDSDCESEPDSADDSQSDDDDDEDALLDTVRTAIFPTSHSQPEMHTDLARQRSATLPTFSNDGTLEHLSVRRQTSRLLRGESLRRQLFQETALNNPVLRRNASVECLPVDSAMETAMESADGLTAVASKGKVKPRHTIIGYSLPVWSAPESCGPSRQTSRQLSLSTIDDHNTLPQCSSEPVHKALSRLNNGGIQLNVQRRTLETSAAYKSRSLGAATGDHRRSYLLAIAPMEVPQEKSGYGTLRKFKKNVGKIFKHKESMGSAKEASNVAGNTASNDSGLECSPPVSSILEHQESVFMSTEAADEFVYTSQPGAHPTKHRGRISSAPIPERFMSILKRRAADRLSAAESIRSDDTCSSLSDHSSRK